MSKEKYLVFNQATIDRLFKCTNPADCFALYGFYYKTAKWQKTNTIKANNLYVKKCLSWGIKRVNNAKKQLKSLGLISIIQQRKDNKVSDWYVKVSYIVTSEQSKLAVHNYNTQNDTVDSNNTQKQQYPIATNSFQDTNAFKLLSICLKTVSIINLPREYKNICDEYKKHKTEFNIKTQTKTKRFTKPTTEEINTYQMEYKNQILINAEQFIDHYESKGWMIGKNKMKCWKSAVRTWLRNNKNFNGSQNKQPFNQNTYTTDEIQCLN